MAARDELGARRRGAGAGRRRRAADVDRRRSRPSCGVCDAHRRAGHRGRRPQRRVRRVGARVRRRRARPDRAGRHRRRRRRRRASSTSWPARSATSRTSCRTDHGLTVGHWPQSIDLATVGGWLACRGAGQYSTRYGKIEDMVVGLEVVLADGTRRPHRRRARAPPSGPTSPSCSSAPRARSASSPGARLRAHPVPPAERRAAYRLRLVRRRARRVPAHPAPRRHAGRAAPLRRRRGRARPRRRRHAAACCSCSTRATRLIVDATMAVVDRGVRRRRRRRRRPRRAGRRLARPPQRRRRRSRRSSRKGFVVDTMEIAGAVVAGCPAIYDDARDAADRRAAARWSPAAHQSHTYPDGACLYFTFAGAPAARRARGDLRRAVGRRPRGPCSADGGAAQPPPRRRPQPRPASWPRRSAPASTCSRRSRQALDPNGILNPGKLGLPVAVRAAAVAGRAD